MKQAWCLFIGILCVTIFSCRAWAEEGLPRATFGFHLTREEFRIDHMAANSRCPLAQRQQGCVITLAYAEPVIGYTTSFEVPLFSVRRLGMSGWTPASFGDYIVHMAGTPLYSPALSLILSTRF